MDWGNIPLFSALCGQPDTVFAKSKSHAFRHLRLVSVGCIYPRVKTSLLSMTWSRATSLERFNIVVPLLLTMGSKSYSTLQVETALIKKSHKSFSDFFSGPSLPSQCQSFWRAPRGWRALLFCVSRVFVREIEDACNWDPTSHCLQTGCASSSFATIRRLQFRCCVSSFFFQSAVE